MRNIFRKKQCFYVLLVLLIVSAVSLCGCVGTRKADDCCASAGTVVICVKAAG